MSCYNKVVKDGNTSTYCGRQKRQKQQENSCPHHLTLADYFLEELDGRSLSISWLCCISSADFSTKPACLAFLWSLLCPARSRQKSFFPHCLNKKKWEGATTTTTPTFPVNSCDLLTQKNGGYGLSMKFTNVSNWMSRFWELCRKGYSLWFLLVFYSSYPASAWKTDVGKNMCFLFYWTFHLCLCLCMGAAAKGGI